VLDTFPVKHAHRLPGEAPLPERVAALRRVSREVREELRRRGHSIDDAESLASYVPKLRQLTTRLALDPSYAGRARHAVRPGQPNRGITPSRAAGRMIDFLDRDEEEARLRALTASVCDSVFAAPPELTVSQWADANRRLSSTSSAEPGKVRDRSRALSPDDPGRPRRRHDQEVVCCKSAQVGLSTADENFIGYCIDQDPSGILVVWPTEKAVRNWSTLRLDALIRETDCLAQKFPRSGGARRKTRSSERSFDGGYLAALSAKSTADLRSFSARRAVGEEIDEWDPDVNEQGDPIELLRARIRAFWNGKLFLISTPTLLLGSRVWKELLSSTWHEFYVPCPHCDHFQVLRFRDRRDRSSATRRQASTGCSTSATPAAS
jgi:phage terminase large subunit GpA-like protein